MHGLAISKTFNVNGLMSASVKQIIDQRMHSSTHTHTHTHTHTSKSEDAQNFDVARIYWARCRIIKFPCYDLIINRKKICTAKI